MYIHVHVHIPSLTSQIIFCVCMPVHTKFLCILYTHEMKRNKSLAFFKHTSCVICKYVCVDEMKIKHCLAFEINMYVSPAGSA